jgi:putative ABC transport system substrate-binding protein
MAPFREVAEAGGLMAYGPNILELWGQRVPVYVDRILKGARAGDLPIEQPLTYELIVNVRTAKALGLTVPPSVLRRADQVVE